MAASVRKRLAAGVAVPPVLLPYQQVPLASRDQVLVYVKSRRIGISWTAASAAVTVSSASRAAGGADTLYIGYNREMARTFIDDCAFWARHLAAFAAAQPGIQDFVFEDEDEQGAKRAIQAFRIVFASGYEIVALSSRPRSLRSRQGFVIIDEAAFHDDLPGLLKAALALLIWGGRVWVISTHNGADNPFNELVEDCRAGRKPFRVLQTTFDEAVADGLYRRICLSTGKTWSAEGERAWVREIYAYYGDDADEELRVIPAQGDGVWLGRALIDACARPEYPVLYWAPPADFVHRPDAERRAAAEDWWDAEVAPTLAGLVETDLSVLGADFARSADLSVIAPAQLAARTRELTVPFLIELRGVPFAEQEWLVERTIRALPRFVAAALDARGLGAQIAERTMQKFGASRVAEVKATIEWYRQTMPRLKARFEDRAIRIPRDDGVRDDLRLVKLVKGVALVPEGRRTKSPRGGERHGDAAIALAMVEHAVGLEAGPIEFHAAGAERLARRAYEADAPLGFGAAEIDPDRGFGAVGGGIDTRGW